MKKILSLMFLLALVLKAEAQQKQYDKPEKVIITGQVLNANEGQVKLEVHRLGLLFNKEVIEKEIYKIFPPLFEGSYSLQ